MARESGTKQDRIAITFFDGVNSSVQQSIARRSELSHSENARAPVIGVLEKREGQVVVGTTIDGGVFNSLGEQGLAYYEDGGTLSKGLIRISSTEGGATNLYYLNQSDEWVPINNDLAQNLASQTFDFSLVDDNFALVNGDMNRMITGPIGVTTAMVSSATVGSLFNSPNANKIAFYKSRIYLADYYDDSGTELKTTVLRSSYPMGIISLLNGDVAAVDGSNNWVFPVTDTKYFYLDSGMNMYEIYRGNEKIATIRITGMTDTSITTANPGVIFESGYSSFLSADEVWIAGTFSGEKQYRWISNSSSVGRDVKQYDTFKLSGGDEDAITMMEPIGNVLLIANRNAMMTWNDYTLESFDIAVGCCSKNGYVKLRNAMYLLHYSGLYAYSVGTYSAGGQFPQLLSRKIERYIKGATKAGLESAAMGVKGLSIFCTIGDSTLYKNDGSLWKVLPQVCFEYNTADQNFYIHTNVTATHFKMYIASDGKEKLTMDSISLGRNAIIKDVEMITNGSFTGNADGWTLGTDWVYGSNKVTLTK